MFKGDDKKLLHMKADKIKVGTGNPSPAEGKSGDLTLRLTDNGIKLFAKYVDKWYVVGNSKVDTAVGSVDADGNVHAPEGGLIAVPGTAVLRPKPGGGAQLETSSGEMVIRSTHPSSNDNHIRLKIDGGNSNIIADLILGEFIIAVDGTQRFKLDPGDGAGTFTMGSATNYVKMTTTVSGNTSLATTASSGSYGDFHVDSARDIILDCGASDEIQILENGGTYTPTSANHVANKKYVDDNAGDGISFDGSTANGLLTYKDADEANALATLTYTELSGLIMTKTGAAESTHNFLTLTNDVNAGAMTGTGTAIKFNQWYYDASTPATEESGLIAVVTETSWRTTASTRDSKMIFQTSLDGTMTEQLSISSAGAVATTGALTVGSIAEVGSDTDKILMSDSGVVKYVTGANLRSYIGAGTGDVSFDGSTGDGLLTYKDADEATVESELRYTSPTLSITNANARIRLYSNANDYATFGIADTGDLTIATLGDGTTDSDLLLSVDGKIELDAATNITLDSANGRFITSNNGTEFSVANSAFAGMILGYTTVGIDAADASYTLTTSFVVTDSAHKVKFVAPPSEAVEIEVSCMVSGSRRLVYFGLSDNATYAAIDFPNTADPTNEHHVWTPAGTAIQTEEIHHKWVVTGLTAGTAYEWWLGAKASGALAMNVKWGGNVTEEFAPFIMKATALPTAVADFAVYG